jgi:hypothetical protein
MPRVPPVTRATGRETLLSLSKGMSLTAQVKALGSRLWALEAQGSGKTFE